MVVLYLETNFLISLALGQDPLDQRVIEEAANEDGTLALSMPQVCIMEAVSTIEQRLKKRISFRESLMSEIGQLERSVKSTLALKLLEQLNQSTIVHDEYTNRILDDFRQALDRLIVVCRLVSVSGETLRQSIASILIRSRYKGYDDLMVPDNLIIHTILEDAKAHRSNTKAFLSGNSKDFGNKTVQSKLKAAGVKYFAGSGKLLEWYRSLPKS